MSRRVLVAGGGVSGLVAAYRLAANADVVLVEEATHLGGKIATTSFRGRPLDLGPDAFITRDEAATLLCRELDLGDELLAPAARSAGVYARGAIRRLPDGLVIGIPTDFGALARSGLVSRRAALRARADRFWPQRMRLEPPSDPSVAAVVGRRLGPEVLAALVDPLIGGINASDVESLSLAAALPQLVPAMQGHRSVSRALAPVRARGVADTGPIFYGLEKGLGALVERLAATAAARGAELRTGTTLHALWRDPTAAAGWRAELDADEEHYDAVVVALPAPSASTLLGKVDAPLGVELSEIPYASVATVTLALSNSAVPSALAGALGGESGLVGNGVLVSRSAHRLVTAVTFTSTKWPRSANPGEVVLRASLGRHRDERALDLDDEALLTAVRVELRELLGITSPPLESIVQRWPASFPQYVRGHLARVERIESAAGALGGLELCGAALRGIGIPACIRAATRAATNVTAQLGGC